MSDLIPPHDSFEYLDPQARYDAWMKLVVFLNQPICPSQLHGTALGCFISLSDQVVEQRFEQLADFFEITPDHPGYLLFAKQFYAIEQAIDLESESICMPLVLPTDDEPLRDRFEAIKWWSVGFIEGIRLGRDVEVYSEQAQEALEDVLDIGALDSSEVEEMESEPEAEKDYAELAHYLELIPKFLYLESIQTDAPEGFPEGIH
ncbi:MAG: UPF0149 family protein [Pseudomonadota bacterium]